MKIFKGKSNEKIIIIGCGRFGSTLANLLSEKNKSITIIDIDEKAFRKLSSSYGGLTVEGDGTDVDLLKASGAESTDTLIASTNDDNTNIMIVQTAKQVFGIKNVVTRIFDTTKKISYEDMDIVSICPAFLSIKEFERIVFNKEVGQI